MKFVGTIIDKNYFDTFTRRKDNKLYIYKMCRWCGEEREMGYSDLDGGNAAYAPKHQCEKADLLLAWKLVDNAFYFMEPR